MARHRVITIELGGTTYPMRWDFNTLATIKELTGQDPMSGVLVLDSVAIVSVIYAGLEAAAFAAGKDRSPLTHREVGSLLDPTDEQQMEDVIGKVYKLAGINSPPKADAPDPQTAPATGESGSPSSGATSSPESTSASASASSGS